MEEISDLTLAFFYMIFKDNFYRLLLLFGYPSNDFCLVELYKRIVGRLRLKHIVKINAVLDAVQFEVSCIELEEAVENVLQL